MNVVFLTGRLGRDPEIRYDTSGAPIARFSLATTEHWTDKHGQKQERTDWHSIVCFHRTAEVARDYLRKGSQVAVHGSLEDHKWTDEQGNKRKQSRVKVDRLELMGRREPQASDGPGVAPEEEPAF